jgi:hypothetical protein
MTDLAPRLEYDASCEGPDPGRLLPIGPHDHPEPRSMTWTNTELAAIKAYAAQCVAAERGRRHRWSESEAVAAAHAAGFAGTHWTMGPEELVHLLNMVHARPNAKGEQQ